jgi:hypothetical protein
MVFAYKQILIIVFLACCMTPFLPGLDKENNEQELLTAYPDVSLNAYYFLPMPDFIFCSTDTGLKPLHIMHFLGTHSPLLQNTLMGYTRVPRDQEKLLKRVGFWSWMTLGSFGLNCAAMALALVVNGPEAGAVSMATHSWFGICNAILCKAYADLNFSVSIYGPKEKKPIPGFLFASGAVLFAGIGISVGFTMFSPEGPPGMPSILGTSISAGLSNILGISSFVYYLLYKNSFKPAPRIIKD